MSDQPPTSADPALWPLYQTVRELSSSEARAECDLAMSGLPCGRYAIDHSRGLGSALRRLRCTLHHRRDATVAVGLASVMPHSASDALDRSLLALLNNSLEYHRNHCRVDASSSGQP